MTRPFGFLLLGRFALGLLLLAAIPGTARAIDKTLFTITNLTNVDISVVRIDEIDNSDWANQNRPDRNFEGRSIARGTGLTEPEDLKTGSRAAYFKLRLAFANGFAVYVRVNQQESSGGSRYRIYTSTSIPKDEYLVVQYVDTRTKNNYMTVMLNVPTASWMQHIPDLTPLSALTLPGTHDTAAFNTSNSISKTQDRRFRPQLVDGIRFWDIRVRRVKGTKGNPKWALYHGDTNLNLSFEDALSAISNFYADHPSEALIMSIKQDKSPESGVTASMSQTFWWYVKNYRSVAWYTDTTYPALGRVRSKVALLRRFSLDQGESSYGFDATKWPDNSSFTISNPPFSIVVQDVYKAGGQDKINAVDRQIGRARANPSSQALYLNFTSDTTGSCTWTPSNCARKVMPTVRTTPITDPSLERLGCIPMDFYNQYEPFLNVLLSANPWPIEARRTQPRPGDPKQTNR